MEKWEEEVRKKRDEELFRRRTLVLDFDVTVEWMRDLKRQVHALDLESTKPIRFLIDSRGGQVEAAIDFYDFVRSEIRAPLIGRVSG